MIASKVIRHNRRHIIRADYNDAKPLLNSDYVIFPRVGSLQSRALRRLLPSGVMLSHREFDFASHSYRLGGYIDKLRDKGWTIVNHDEAAKTKDVVHCVVIFTRYELFAEFTPELLQRLKAFCIAVDNFEAMAGVMINLDDIKPAELFVLAAKGKAREVVLSQELDYQDAMAKLAILRQYRRSVRLEFTGYAKWINKEFLRAPQAANLGGGNA